MRRKSERVKDKDKTEKKPEKSSKKSRTRSSRRRKKSSSTSPESSEAEDIDSVQNSHDDTEEEQSSGRSRREKPKVVYAEDDARIDVVVEAANDEKGANSRTRRASKKQLAEGADDQVKPDVGEETTVSVAEVKGETSDPKHKEKEGKSSLWQVKSADCSSGEIKKLKLCIVRPPEPELSPRKRKKLNRLSHRDVADGESEENTARDSSGERRKSRRSLRNASASDDSMSPDKFKGHGSSRGKHKSGDSSEEGQRTQDSSEEIAVIVDVPVDKHDSTEDEVVVCAAVDDTFEEVHETTGSPDGNSDVRDPLEDQPQSPADEESAESSNSPISRETPVEPVDPFDQLKAEGTKPISKDTAAIVSGKPVLEELVVGSCDSTEEPRSGALEKKTQEVAAVVEEIPHVSDLFVQKSEVCDSSVDLQKEKRSARILSEDRPKAQRMSSEEKSEARGSSKERTSVLDSVEKKPQGRGVSEEKPVSLEPSEERRSVRDSPEEKPDVSDSSKKIPKSRDSSEERRAARDLSKKQHKSHDLSEERTQVVDSSERLKVSDPLKHTTKTSVSSEDKPKGQNLLQEEPAPEKTKVEEKSSLQRSPRSSADEPKHRSRRLIRTSAGDRHKRVSPQKSDVEVLSTKGKEEKEATSKKSRDEKDISTSVKDEVSSSKTRAERDASPKKSREEKAASSDSKTPRESSHRTRIVWDEKPATESRRHRIVQESVPPSESSREHSAKHSPPKPEEVKDVPTRVRIPDVKVKANSAAEIAPPKRHEKITLKRSFSTKTAVTDAQGNGESSDKDQQQISDKEDATSVRKRRWGGSKTSTTGVKPVLSISSDSLKSLIPEAKPLEISEVELSPEEEEKEEGEVEGATSEIEPEEEREEEEKEVVVPPPPRELEPVREVKLVFPPGASTNVPLPDEHRDKGVRKISLVTDDMRALSPARHRVSNVLYVTNLVRPFTVNQLRELLARTGAIAEDGFWIDAIKSRCYVKYGTEQEAQETRHALHGVRWPVSNPKQLCVDYGRPEDLAAALTVGQPPPQPPRKTQPLRVDGSGAWPSDLDREKERVRLAREKERIERERVRDRDADRERNLKMAGSIREWDLGKTEGGAFEDGRQSREERGGEKERRLRKDRNYRSPSPRDVPARKIKKKEEDAPAKLLDDLFRKTKLTPCIYWLPLTADQIVVKEEMRRKHMAEHERRMAEIRKVEKERLSRMQGGRPPPRRYVDNNKRRRHSPSGSPKK